MPLVHADIEPVNRTFGEVMREMKELGVLSDANVVAADTVALLRSTLNTNLSAATQHGEYKPIIAGVLRCVDIAKETGVISDALLAPLTTVAGLIALSPSTNSSNRNMFLP